MPDVETLLNQFIADHKAGGEADPHGYLDQVEPNDRGELAALMDAYLAQAPRRAWDAEAYASSAAPELVEAMSRSLQGQSGTWPALLPRLRERARLRRSELVGELAARLGAQNQRSKVERYYHEMEQGMLPAEGVSDDVLDALGQIVGQTREALRRAGQALGPGPAGEAPAAAPAFARTSQAPTPPASPGTAEPEPWDEVDRLFRGG